MPAARRLFHADFDATLVKDNMELLGKWHLWTEDFSRQLEPAEFPIAVIVRTQKPFSSRKFAMYDPDNGKKLVFDALGEAIWDEHTGEFLAGIVTCRDITAMTSALAEQVERDEQRFELICDSMPQMIWTATPDGMHYRRIRNVKL